MNIKIELNSKSIQNAIKQLESIKSKIPTMRDELLLKSCQKIREKADELLDVSGLNSGFIAEIKNGWQTPTKMTDGSYLLRNYGRGYSAEFGIGIVGQGSYDGEVAPNYEYNIKTRYKNRDGSWIFKVTDINTLDIKQESVLPRAKTGEVVYEEGRSIMTQGQKAVMFCFNAIMDFINNQQAKKIWQDIKEREIG